MCLNYCYNLEREKFDACLEAIAVKKNEVNPFYIERRNELEEAVTMSIKNQEVITLASG